MESQVWGQQTEGDTLGPLQSICQPPNPISEALLESCVVGSSAAQGARSRAPATSARSSPGGTVAIEGPRASETPRSGTAAASSLVSRVGPEGQHKHTPQHSHKHTHRGIAAHSTALT